MIKIQKRLFQKVFLAVLFIGMMVNCGYAAPTELSVEEIVKEYADGIVLVATHGPRKTNTLGSGFIINKEGDIVTNYHIVQSALRIAVKLKDGRTYDDVPLLRYDKKKDIAILKINAKNLTTVKLGDSDALSIGQRVVAIGNPLGLETTVSDGLISSIRQVDKNLSFLQISTPISPGSSGGPLFNLKGEVIGITVGTNTNGQNINFAIPINCGQALIASKKTTARYAQLASPAGAQKKGHYKVKSGDTLFSLAKKYNTSVDVLMEMNKLSNTTLFLGQKMKVPELK